jgi:hypothetical protein
MKEQLLDQDTPVKETPLALVDVFVRCDRNETGQSWAGIVVYIATISGLYCSGYCIYRAQQIEQPRLTSIQMFGDLSAVSFLGFAIVTFNWHDFEKGSCLHKSSTGFWKGLGRYLLFVASASISTAIYGHLRTKKLFQHSLNSDLTPDQYNVYIVVFSTIGCIFVYWFLKLGNFKWAKPCCRPRYRNKLVFLRLVIIMAVLNVGSYMVCQVEECDYHPHHWFYGYSLVILSTPLMDNWFDYVLQGLFWMFVVESNWNGRVVYQRFFI